MTDERFREMERSMAKIEGICEKMSSQLDNHTNQDNENFKDVKEDIKELTKTVTTLSVLQDADDKLEEKKENTSNTIKITLLTMGIAAAVEGAKQVWSRLSGS